MDNWNYLFFSNGLSFFVHPVALFEDVDELGADVVDHFQTLPTKLILLVHGKGELANRYSVEAVTNMV